jgi:drug/metabolite transporter (DMT)-like permease
MTDPAEAKSAKPKVTSVATLKARWAKLPGNLRGGLWVLASTLFFSAMVAAIKVVGQRLHVTEILFFRQMVMIVLALPVILRGWPGSMQSARIDLQTLRVFAAFCAMLMGFTAVIHMPLANATTLAFGKTFFMTILAIIFLQEVVGIRRWSAVFVGFAGVLIVAWPQPGASFDIYALLAICSAACVAVVMVIVRKLSQVDQPVTILTYQAIGVGLLMLAPTIYFWKTPTLEEWALIVFIGVLSALGQTCNILGLRAGEASAVAPLDYSRLLFAVLFGWLIFSEWPEPRVFVGALLIIGAAVYTLHRERQLGRKGRAEAKLETGTLR